MKRILSVLLLVLFILPIFSAYAFAEETSEEIANISPLGTAYCTSEKNSLWTPAKSISDGLYGTEDWHGWECKYPDVAVGQDTSAGFSGEFCGIKFDENYYRVEEIKMNIGLHTKAGGQNAKYTIQALVDGKWQDVAILMDDDATPTSDKYADYNAVMADPNAETRVNANLSVKLDTPVVTNNVRVVVSEYAKNYEGGDVLIFPFIYELEIYGVSAPAPDIILPEGAFISTNVAWYSYPSAKNSANGTYPFLAIDGNDETYWETLNFEGGEYFTLILDKEYEIGGISVLFERTNDKYQNTVLEYYYDGVWEKVPDAFPHISIEAETYAVRYEFPATLASGIRLKMRTDMDCVRINDFQVHLADSKTYVFDNRFTSEQLISASNGNLAIIGKPYSSTSFTPYSDESFIIDGMKGNSNLWFTGNLNVPEYCGVKFDYPQKISKAIVSVRVPNVVGREIMKFEIQALVNDTFVTVANGRSYANGVYETEYTFEQVETTDVRIVIKEANGAIPNLMELELFSNDNVNLPMFVGMEKVVVDENENTPTPPAGDEEEQQNEISFLHFLPLIAAIFVIIIIYIVNRLLKKRQKVENEEVVETTDSEVEEAIEATEDEVKTEASAENENVTEPNESSDEK